jgi:hypothetical protein
MLVDWKSEVVGGTDNVARLLQRVLDLARCKKSGSSCILANSQSEEQQQQQQQQQQLALGNRLTTWLYSLSQWSRRNLW